MVIELGSRRARSISSTLSCKATSCPLRRGLQDKNSTVKAVQGSDRCLRYVK